MARQFYHLKDVKNLEVVSDGDGEYMLYSTLHEDAQPSEPCGLLNNFITRSDRGNGFPVCFGYNRDIIAAVDSSRDSLEDVVSFFESTHKKPR